MPEIQYIEKFDRLPLSGFCFLSFMMHFALCTLRRIEISSSEKAIIQYLFFSAGSAPLRENEEKDCFPLSAIPMSFALCIS